MNTCVQKLETQMSFTNDIQEYQTGIKINNTMNVKNSKNIDIEAYNKDPALTFVLRKIERLTGALYVITDIFPEREPLKNELRNEGLELLKDISLCEIESSDHTSFVLNKMQRVVSLLEVSFLAGFVSQMNASILREECKRIKDLMIERSELSERAQSIFPEDYFSEQEQFLVDKKKLDKRNNPTNTTTPKNFYVKDSSKGVRKRQYKGQDRESSIKDITKGQLFDRYSEQSVLRQAVSSEKFGNSEDKRYGTTEGQKEGQKKTKNHKPLNSKMVHNVRKEKIIDIIRKGEEVSIKDISLHIKDCSEKTIQRELIAMVESGRLVKTGERRWSRYALA